MIKCWYAYHIKPNNINRNGKTVKDVESLLEKESTNYEDIFDIFRMSLQFNNNLDRSALYYPSSILIFNLVIDWITISSG
jgi:hypothetical protein